MINGERIIISMTSYPSRIRFVPISIWALLCKQTVKPDEIHLFLALSQFPHQYNDLPQELQLLVAAKQVNIHWLDHNTYVHKRHEIFKSDVRGCVFFIDDDVIYDNRLIQYVMETHKKYPNSIVCYNRYDAHRYDGIHILYGNVCTDFNPHINTYRWCGQSMIPASVYPYESLSTEAQLIRDKTSPISDECWLQPWLVKNNTPINYCWLGWGKDIANEFGLPKSDNAFKGICSWSNKKNESGYTQRDLWLHNTLLAYPNILAKYKELFNYGE